MLLKEQLVCVLSGPGQPDRKVVAEPPQLIVPATSTKRQRQVGQVGVLFVEQLCNQIRGDPIFSVRHGKNRSPSIENRPDGSDDDSDWLVLLDPTGHRVFAFQQVPTLARPTWPLHDVPKQMHHDFRVPDMEELRRQRQRAEELGATLLYDRTDDDGEPLYALADPAGHPFCILVGSE